MPNNDEHYYLQAMQEAEGDNRQEGLWAKALYTSRHRISLTVFYTTPHPQPLTSHEPPLQP